MRSYEKVVKDKLVKNVENIANFSGKDFRNDPIDFSGFMFGDWAEFSDAQFGNRANFTGAQFGGSASFEDAQFGDEANFAGAQFADEADFAGAQFGDWVDFSGVDWAVVLKLFGNQSDKRKTWAEQRGLAPNRFQRISFQGATFKGAVDFSNREFTGSTLFSPRFSLRADIPTTFAQAPRFHNATLHPDTSFDGAQFLDVGKPIRDRAGIDRDRASIERAAHAYRTLKLAFSKQQATRQEQQFLRLEMAEEALLAPSVREWLRGQREHDLPPRFYYTIYRLLSDYGFSIWRPVVLLLASLSVLFLALPSCQAEHSFSDYMNVAIPALFPSPFSSHDFDWCCIEETSAALQTVQKVLAVLAWFLIGLALRNRFKMK